jgi:hypothetical protein
MSHYFAGNPALLAVLGLLAGGFVVAVALRAIRTTLALRRMGVPASRREHDMEAVAAYTLRTTASTALLPDRAWRDLDMDEVFQHLDRTVGWPGQHLLYRRLRREDHPFDALRAFELGVQRLSDDDATRHAIRAELGALADWRASLLPSLFATSATPLPGFARFLVLLSVGAIVCAAGAVLWPVLLIPFIVIVAANLIVRPWLGLRISGAIPAMRAVPALHRAAHRLGALTAPELASPVMALRVGEPGLRMIARAARWLNAEPTGAAELASYFFAYVNLLFLLDLSAYAWSEAALRERSATLHAVYDAVGELDAMQSVATLRAEGRTWTRPIFAAHARRTLACAALAHPLLADPVTNSVTMDGRSMLLTGSNMSGKSTFIRAVGVNAILARTLHTVFAEEWRAGCWAVRTSIGRADSLLERTSYYRAEVDAVGELLAPRAGEPRLILIDELFRGTNSVERVAGAKAVLSALDAGDDLVIVATHDMELLPLLPRYVAHHFREEVQGGALIFDYRLHDGPSSTRNALAILELAGYPPDVVADARRTAEQRDAGPGTPSPGR